MKTTMTVVVGFLACFALSLFLQPQIDKISDSRRKPDYFIRQAEYSAMTEKCSLHEGLEGAGVIVLKKGGIKYQALCKDGQKITWNKTGEIILIHR